LRTSQTESITLGRWSRTIVNPATSWRDVDLITPQIVSLIPARYTFVVVDDDVFRNELANDRRAVPCTERHGEYWGPPADDTNAIQAIEERRGSGVSFVVFAWPSFWSLDYYSGLNRYLRSEFRWVLETDLLVVFDVRTQHCEIKVGKDGLKAVPDQPHLRFRG
jgi:hypothetical protein